MNPDTVGPELAAPLPNGAAPVSPAEDWDWEAFRIGGQLYLYCYLRETVLIPLAASGLTSNEQRVTAGGR